MQFPGLTNEFVTHDPLMQIFPSPHVVPKFSYSKLFKFGLYIYFLVLPSAAP